MPCFHPILCYQPFDGGSISFTERKDHRSIRIPCRQCIGCRRARQDAWALRCMFEALMHRHAWFATFTYSDEFLPQRGSLDYRDVQLFCKRLRRRVGRFRFFVAGEYGGQFGRPHWHMLIFGVDFADLERINSMRSKEPVFRAPVLAEAWPQGFHSLGFVTLASARYTASYAVDKITGAPADAHYSRVDDSTGEIYQVVPEFAQMSRGGRGGKGIGYSFLERYWRDIFLAGDGAVVLPGGKRAATPGYFNRVFPEILEKAGGSAALLTELESKRLVRANERAWDNTPERLAVREAVQLAGIKFNAERGR